MSLSQIKSLEKYSHRFSETIPTRPTGKFATMILLRETKSYAIFTTEGGEQQDIERTQAGLEHGERLDRLVMFKRKQIAPERRTGKALARQYGVFPLGIKSKDGTVNEVVFGIEAINAAKEDVKGKKGEAVKEIDDCHLISGMCSRCADCLTYGFAAIEGEGARKARVYTDSCFSVRPYPLIQRKIKFNVIDEQAQTSGTITEFDHTLPEVFLPSIETTQDLTLDEFVYVLNNVLKTNRYGKEGTRQGFVRNHVLALAFSDMEICSNLEFTQAYYDAFLRDQQIDMSEGYLSLQDFKRHTENVIDRLTSNLNGRLALVTGQELDDILSEMRALNQDERRLANFLRELNRQSASFVISG